MIWFTEGSLNVHMGALRLYRQSRTLAGTDDHHALVSETYAGVCFAFQSPLWETSQICAPKCISFSTRCFCMKSETNFSDASLLGFWSWLLTDRLRAPMSALLWCELTFVRRLYQLQKSLSALSMQALFFTF